MHFTRPSLSLLGIWLGFLLPLLSGCTSVALSLANGLAAMDDYRVVTGLSYGPHALNKLDVYRPADGKARGTVVFFYGGCWGACKTYSREQYGFVAQALTSLGYNAVIPDYRLYPEVRFPEIMADSAAAVRWVSQHQVYFGGESGPVFLMGHSAGGHIAALLASDERYLGTDVHPQIRGFIGLAGAYDFIFDQPYMHRLFADVDYPQTQPSHFIDGTEPPLLLLYGDADTAVYRRNIDNMTSAVRRAGGQVSAHIYPDMDHTTLLAALSIPLRNHYPVMEDIKAFLLAHSEERR